LEYSLALRDQENQCNLSMTAILIGLVTAAVYLWKFLYSIKIGDVKMLYGSLLVILFIFIAMATITFVSSFCVSYFVPNAADHEIRRILEEKNDASEMAKKINIHLVMENGNKADWNIKASRKKMKLAGRSRKYMFFSGLVLMCLLGVLSWYNLSFGVCDGIF